MLGSIFPRRRSKCGFHALLGSLRRGKESSRFVPSPDLTGLLFGAAYFYLPLAIYNQCPQIRPQRMTSHFP